MTDDSWSLTAEYLTGNSGSLMTEDCWVLTGNSGSLMTADCWVLTGNSGSLMTADCWVLTGNSGSLMTADCWVLTGNSGSLMTAECWLLVAPSAAGARTGRCAPRHVVALHSPGHVWRRPTSSRSPAPGIRTAARTLWSLCALERVERICRDTTGITAW